MMKFSQKSDSSINDSTKSSPPVFRYLTIFLGLGILGAIALPSFLNQSYKLCGNGQAEARTYVGSMNRAQQAFQLENKAFSNSFADLGLGIKEQTKNFQYSIRTTKTAAFNYGVVRHEYIEEKEGFWPFQWTKRTNTTLKSYVGGVFLVPAITVDPTADKKEMTTAAVLCESITPGTAKPAEPILKNGVPTCGIGTKKIGGR